MKLSIYIINSFTSESFKGNPAGVCLLQQKISEELMQSVASELNLSETAFISLQDKQTYSIRYFTPTVEIDFCGHATLAASKLILEKFNCNQVNFVTDKKLHLSAEKYNSEIKMIFPLYNYYQKNISDSLRSAFGISTSIDTVFNEDLSLFIIEVSSKEELLAIAPHFSEACLVPDKIKELVITCKSDDNEYDFYSRCFCPWIGINEDPATGAVHSVLANYWGNRLNKNTLNAFQCSDRGGYLKLTILNETELEVISSAKIVFEGQLTV